MEEELAEQEQEAGQEGEKEDAGRKRRNGQCLGS